MSELENTEADVEIPITIIYENTEYIFRLSYYDTVGMYTLLYLKYLVAY